MNARRAARRWTRFPLERLGWFLERAWEARIETIVLVGEDSEGPGMVLPRRAVACGVRADERPTGREGEVERKRHRQLGCLCFPRRFLRGSPGGG